MRGEKREARQEPGTKKMKNKVIIANMSGFYGDRLSAAREMVEGGPIDFLTGDYLAELTMAILYRAKSKRPEAGYAYTFLKQMEEVMGICLDKGIRVVANAGGLNPAGLAKALEELSTQLGLQPKIAYITGDDLMPRISALQKEGEAFRHLDKGITLAENRMLPLTANAYLGCWGIVEALKQGADIVVTGRVADTAVVMGPAAYHFGWAKDDWNALAGAATAGHIIECGGQATGGNYSFFKEVHSFSKVGFPIAEIHADGSSVITKHPGTGGLVSVGTVTAQLLYEINTPTYITPDVVAHFDSIQLKQEAEDRVSVSTVKGNPATASAKVTLNCMAGFQNEMTFYIAGLDIEEKAAILKQSIQEQFEGEHAFSDLQFQFFPTHKLNPNSNEEAFAQLKVSVIDTNPKKAGKLFTSKLVELALCTVPGISLMHPPGPGRPRIVHFPTLISKKYLQQKIHIHGEVMEVEEVVGSREIKSFLTSSTLMPFSAENQATSPLPLGHLFATRSGDKGGNANLGIWGKTPEAYAFLKDFLTAEKLKALLPDTAPFNIIRYEFPNLLGLNFYIIGLLGEGVAASSRLDPQAKTLGEYLRAKIIDIPNSLV